MRQEVEEHLHPESGEVVVGMKLEKGDIVEENDVYDSTNGKWSRAGSCFAGNEVIGTNRVVWIRPVK